MGTKRAAPPLPSATQARREQSADLEAEEEEADQRRGNEVELDELYGTIRSDVVGIQYYRGLVGRGEYVMLRREPTNQYDKNAIQVVNGASLQVGHIPRGVALKLAGMMDDGLLIVEGRMIGQNLDMAKRFVLPIDINIYAKPSLREVLDPELTRAFGSAFNRPPPIPAVIPVATQPIVAPSQGNIRPPPGAGPSRAELEKAQELKRLMDGLSKVKNDDQSHGIMDALVKDMDVMGLPLHPDPPGLAKGNLHVNLLPHQSQALQWMIERENPKLPAVGEPPVQFWSRRAQGGREHWFNMATQSPQTETPVLGRGGIIADGMGLGKTLTTLALTLATKSEPLAAGEANATLIVCPLSVLGNWEKQIKDHVVSGNLSVYTYHGATKGITAAKLAKYDVVLTTYQTVATDITGKVDRSKQYYDSDDDNKSSQKGKKKQKTASKILSTVQWRRIVADEGHVLKNPKSHMTQAYAGLKAARRWICTGTPIVNSPADLGSLLTCIQVCKPLDQANFFKSILLRPLKAGDPMAANTLQAIVGQSLLRRNKDSRNARGEKLVELPPIDFFECIIPLDEETRALYDEISDVSRSRFNNTLRTGEGRGSVLAMITRLRQLCLSKDLVPQSFLDEMRNPTPAQGEAVSAMSIPEEQRQEIINKLKVALADAEECAICSDTMARDEARITDCGHPGCIGCLSAWLVKASTCPICRHFITLGSLFALPPDESDYIEPAQEVKPIKSAKIDELCKYLTSFHLTEKSLVFSQFTGFLNHVEAALEEAGVACCRFDGSMPQRKRQQVIDNFQRPRDATDDESNPQVMLISLKSGAVGLNLTAASNVFLLGQKKDVRVFQLIAENTIESKVLDIQRRKDDLVATAFEKTSKEIVQTKKKGKFEDLRELFGVDPSQKVAD
ncbi:uncharacterized protein MKK02DRAFT_39660 [Dioszegia hungarica]|uniref:SWI/SNF related, matrix associated, actin dependent regulator of chromatin, subfamily a, member 3 n=1 Tax=Dioszegia hungarica TaxID=4972 RepID=A0AA38LYS3_9TREE|nr:uncharacterized protein MKK02DRAFT_39660 [Dioszegia hungarica]KAI9639359.1 putative SWI/SNF related, matrix associated, actin dependent regulator of chromatin, subfamily a, member 3 [Dioszegia hungarica]